MKTKKSAASAALKPTETKTTTAAPTPVASAPKIVASAPSVSAAAPKATTASAKTPAAPKTAAVASTPAPAPAAAPAPVKAAAPTKPAAPAKPAAAEPKATTIEVKIDVGLGNVVYLRGQGSGLNWERGVPLSCVDGGTWRWTQTAANPITFKVLLNDQVWSAGSDLVVAPGQKVEVSPTFA